MRSSTLILVFECLLFVGWHQDSTKRKNFKRINTYRRSFRFHIIHNFWTRTQRTQGLPAFCLNLGTLTTMRSRDFPTPAALQWRKAFQAFTFENRAPFGAFTHLVLVPALQRWSKQNLALFALHSENCSCVPTWTINSAKLENFVKHV